MLRFVVAGLLVAAGASARTQEPDSAREQRWAQEIAPAIVVGEPLQLELASGRKFLASHAEAPKARAIRAEVNALCGEVAEHAVALVDAFGIPDSVLRAPAGRAG